MGIADKTASLGRLAAAGLAFLLMGVLSPAMAEYGDLRAQFREHQDAYLEAQAEGDFEAMERIFFEQQDLLNQARGDLQAENAAQSRDPATLRNLATVLAMDADYDLAAETLARAAQLAPDDAENWLMLGEMRMHLGDAAAPDAAGALRQCLALEPGGRTAAHAYGLMTALYIEMGLIPLARRVLEEGRGLDEGHPALEIGALALDIAEGRIEEAYETLDAQGIIPFRGVELIKHALELFEASGHAVPNTAAAHTAYARILFRVGETHRCAAPLERAITLEPGDASVWNFLASVHLTLGRFDAARHAFAQSLTLDEDQPWVREIVEALDAGEPVAPEDMETEDFTLAPQDQPDQPLSPFMGVDAPAQN